MILVFSVEISVSSRIAICLSGQLARLELGSKIARMIRPNLEKGHHISLYVVLDNGNEIKYSHPTFYKSKYMDGIYSGISELNLTKLINDSVYTQQNFSFSLQVSIHPPVVQQYNSIEHEETASECYNATFQNIMSWRSELRECVKQLQRVED